MRLSLIGAGSAALSALFCVCTLVTQADQHPPAAPAADKGEERRGGSVPVLVELFTSEDARVAHPQMRRSTGAAASRCVRSGTNEPSYRRSSCDVLLGALVSRGGARASGLVDLQARGLGSARGLDSYDASCRRVIGGSG